MIKITSAEEENIRKMYNKNNISQMVKT